METCRRTRVRRVISLKSVNCSLIPTSSPAHAPIPVISPTTSHLPLHFILSSYKRALTFLAEDSQGTRSLHEPLHITHSLKSFPHLLGPHSRQRSGSAELLHSDRKTKNKRSGIGRDQEKEKTRRERMGGGGGEGGRVAARGREVKGPFDLLTQYVDISITCS